MKKYNKGDFLENVQLMHGDCMELMQKIPSASVDLILCDLPYGMTDCSWDIEIPPYKLWAQYNRIIKETGVIALFGIQPFMSKVILSNAKNYRYNWYWMKNGTTGFTFSKYQPLRKIEEIAVFYKKGGQYYPQGIRKIENPKWTKGAPDKEGSIYGNSLDKKYCARYTNYPNNVLKFNNEASNIKKRLHPTQKPVNLLEYLIKTYTKVANDGECPTCCA